MLDCIPPWLVQEEKLVIIGTGFYRPDDLPVTQPNQQCQSSEGNKTVITTTREDDALTARPFLIQHRTLEGRGVGSLTPVHCVMYHVLTFMSGNVGLSFMHMVCQ